MRNLDDKDLNFLIKNHLNYLNESLVAGQNVQSGDYVNFPNSLLDEGRVRSSKTKSGKKVPGKYLTKDKAAMKGEIERVSKLKSDDPSAYGKWEADYKARNTKSGKPHKTKKSAATIAYEKKFGKKNENIELLRNVIKNIILNEFRGM